MDSFEFNKIAAAVLVTILLIIGIKEISDIIFHVEKPQQSAYKIAGVDLKTETNSETTKKDELQLNLITPLLASASIDEGANLFKRCAACHVVEKGGANKVGPGLWNIVNNKSAASEGYKYSAALQAYGKNWTFEALNKFLYKPTQYIKGNKMGFAGLNKESDRANIIAFLNSKSDSPAPLK
ncbi:MAG: cytochrome C [alpha proteobacterium QL1]|jgi:Cytochrome c2|nr:MAG: cytochrome C [alpha proteobacterium QL1]